MLAKTSVSVELAENRSIEIGTGKIANLASGSCTLQMGDTVLLVAACSGSPFGSADFLPLQVDYREKYSAAGKFPGGYIKREGRPNDKEILTCRMTDRPVRPLFPKDFFDEIQIQALLLSADGENDSDILCVLGASVALHLSDLPFQGPIGALRVGYVDGQYVANPTHDEMERSEMEMIYAGLADKVIMIEGDGKEISEEMMKGAMEFANEIVKKQIDAQNKLREQALAMGGARAKKEPELHPIREDVMAAVVEHCSDKIEAACLIADKTQRIEALDALRNETVEATKDRFADDKTDEIDAQFKRAFDEFSKKTIRNAILEKNYRPDGRGLEDLRQLDAEVGVLPRVHGSGLFSRGETQALVIAALGAASDTQDKDVITGGVSKKKFYLHYNFPNYSVGETGRIMGPGRREIGHGNLAERSLAQVMPEDYPYTVRCVSEIMASNGSTSMASVCGGSLAMMDAGVPIKSAVAGISCGLVTDEDKTLLLTDILGAEDHFGDMDFKVCGTRSGITGFQLDLKIAGISIDLLCQAMERNKQARMKILDVMNSTIPKHRDEINPNAPRIESLKIDQSKIGALIGPGGRVIRDLVDRTGAQIDVEDDGTVNVFATNGDAMKTVREFIEGITAEPEIDKIYRGQVKGVKDFGAFVEILPGQEGLLHISEMANYRVGKVTDICKEGDYVSVKVIDVDKNSGKIRLSRKAALEEMDS